MIYDVIHKTGIRYAGLVRLARFNLRLRPAFWPGQMVSDFRLEITPRPATLREDSGPWLVNETRLSLREAISQLDIETRFRVEVSPNLFDPTYVRSAPISAIRAMAMAQPHLSATSPASYLFASSIAQGWGAIGAWAAPFLADDLAVIDAAMALMHAIHDGFTFDAVATAPDNTPADAFARRRGVCQDFAHVMICAARAHGLPAAYVSGYLRTLPPPGMDRLVGADAMHAWVAIWCGPDLGWVGFDPTNAMLAGTDHIFVAMGRDYADVAPVDGVFHGGADQAMTVSVDVAPVVEA